MKRLFCLLLCIGIFGAARGQTIINYWFDQRSTDRNQIALTSNQSDLLIDVAHLKEGIHTLFLQPEDSSQLGVPKGFVFARVFAADDIYSFRCWFDGDESTAVTGPLEGSHIMLDVSSLSDGLHTIQIQLAGNHPSLPQSYMFIKVPQMVNAPTLTYVCLVDDQLFNQQTINNPTNLIHVDLDVANLEQGLHKIQVMLVSESGAVTGSYSSFFYRTILNSELQTAELIYSIDGKQFASLSGSTNSNQMHFDVDVNSLDDGLHRITVGMAGSAGMYANIQSAWFYKIPEGGEGIYRYEYWLNDNEAEQHQVDLPEHVFNYQLISLLPVEEEPIRSKAFQFAYRSDTIPVVYAKNDFHVRFWASGEQLAIAETQYVDERVCDTILADTLRATNTITRPQENEIHWFKVNLKHGDSLAIKANIACLLQVFSPSGEETYSGDAIHSTQWNGCHAKETGSYYVALHDVSSKTASSVTLSYQHIDRYAILSQDVNTVGDAGYNTITFEGNGFDSLLAVDFISSQKTIHALAIGHESNVRTTVVLDCQNVPHNLYDAVFYFPDDEEIYVDEALTIEEATEIQLSTSLDYDPTYLKGDVATFTYTVSNDGNMTAYSVPISIELYSDTGNVGDIYVEGVEVPTLYESTIEALENDSAELSDEDKSEIHRILNGNTHNHIFYIIKVNKHTSHTTTILTRIPPRSKRIITIRTKGTGSISGRFTSHNGSFPPVQDGNFGDFNDDEGGNGGNSGGDGPGGGNPGGGNSGGGNSGGSYQRPSWFCCHHKNIEDGLNYLSYIPGVGCVSSIAAAVTAEYAGIACDNVAPPSLRDRVVSWLGVGLACSGAKGVAGALAYIGSGIASAHAITSGNEKDPDCDEPDDGKSDPVDPSDPNDIRGYMSESGSRYMRQEIETIHYEIEYENDTAVATAPAHTIIVRDTLDANRLDLTSFAATEVTIGDRKMKWNTPQSGIQTLDMRTRMNVIAQVQLDYSDQTGIAQWTITSLDPLTMEPITDAEVGVLPVNYDGNGMGTLSYRIRLKETFADGAQISNRASIIFDNNDPILTPVWTNTIDAVKPTSAITNVEVTGDSIQFTLDTYDARSQMWYSTIYARADTLAEWQTAGVAYDDVSKLQLRDGWTQFYVLATDSAGNVEAKDAVAEYTIEDGLVTYYLVTFYDEDETTILCQRQWAEGAMPSCSAPYKEPDGIYSYMFSHWNPNVVNVTEDATYVAAYQATPIVPTGLGQIGNLETPIKLIKDGVMFIIFPDGRKFSILGSEIR